MRFYLASRYDRKDEIERYAASLRERGHEITSRWHEPDAQDGEEWAQYAMQDLADLFRAQRVLCFTVEPTEPTTGGHHVEFGLAMMANRLRREGGHFPPIVVGPRVNVFHYLVEQYDSLDDYLELLDRLEA